MLCEEIARLVFEKVHRCPSSSKWCRRFRVRRLGLVSYYSTCFTPLRGRAVTL
ncbi:hypothetical protein HMPREF0742_02499 [Rothia aeria F0184]|uniref:Uncharacterized protein n=3 Tax=Rothia aeria TaxID=172042 RepID=A0A2Z5QVI7_9MICC|nr:hypothetical protein HMPREF1324_1629 [Rothia aeria F0474]ERT63998.1 hypothetical protein HMPREF0742_02499 [Rothia aeria F0184]BAV86407.1 hypothetical protein RA11412_0108 [Rothia aeria]